MKAKMTLIAVVLLKTVSLSAAEPVHESGKTSRKSSISIVFSGSSAKTPSAKDLEDPTQYEQVSCDNEYCQYTGRGVGGLTWFKHRRTGKVTSRRPVSLKGMQDLGEKPAVQSPAELPKLLLPFKLEAQALPEGSLVILKWTQEDCPPCRALETPGGPLDQAAAKYGAQIFTRDWGIEMDTAEREKKPFEFPEVTSTPTLIFLKKTPGGWKQSTPLTGEASPITAARIFKKLDEAQALK